MAEVELPSLHALRCFEAATRLQSITLAGQELFVTHGAVSRQVRALEETLGRRLFERRNRRIVPTQEGRALAQQVANAFDLIRAGLAELRRGGEGPLVLSCEPTLTLRWLIPRLERFQRGGPMVALQLATAGGPISFRDSGAHLAIRRADFGLPEGVHVVPLMDEWVGPVCSRQWLRRRRKPLAAEVTVLHTRTRPDAWSSWQEQSGVRIGRAAERSFDHFSLSLEAAQAGLGLAVGPYPLVEREVAAGRLVAPFGFVKGKIGYILLSPRPFEEQKRTSALVRWLRREAVSGSQPPRGLRRT